MRAASCQLHLATCRSTAADSLPARRRRAQAERNGSRTSGPRTAGGGCALRPLAAVSRIAAAILLTLAAGEWLGPRGMIDPYGNLPSCTSSESCQNLNRFPITRTHRADLPLGPISIQPVLADGGRNRRGASSSAWARRSARSLASCGSPCFTWCGVSCRRHLSFARSSVAAMFERLQLGHLFPG